MNSGDEHQHAAEGPIVLRAATSQDEPWLRRAIHAAWRWRDPWDEADFAAHLARAGSDSYVDGFGRRRGDSGVIAEAVGPAGERFVGAAWYRFFTEQSARAGFVAPEAPEIIVAVEEAVRGRGVGRLLLLGLLRMAREQGVERLSLHVSGENRRARQLYESCGFVDSGVGGNRGTVMVLEARSC